ncbi:hypothetical protein GQ57_19215 [Burkholderia sp. MSh2]|uniref:Uncharacterized protein n=1 Tax=Burkholderia paludis TaxID=1506587 RepID=A0A6J5DK89_9BURK|nr:MULTISPECIES: hypothetical protein [Burkholderia]KEZ04313.1 hypothetical protein GQ57_19215 [Burkholderia sp. MSh2]CAB3753286.1 hypothetical protein LMG30113_01937 [Burkholderia paludis]VWB66677.1 hypothetical protein BPA30113_02983 [Burkholderia paludis]
MNTRRESRLRGAWIVGFLTVAVVLAIATGWFVVYGLIVAVSSDATDNLIAVVIRETRSYPALAVLLLAGLVAAVIDLVKLARGKGA